MEFGDQSCIQYRNFNTAYQITCVLGDPEFEKMAITRQVSRKATHSSSVLEGEVYVTGNCASGSGTTGQDRHLRVLEGVPPLRKRGVVV